MPYLEFLIPSVDYSDYLAVTLLHNMRVADHIVIVTSPRDVDTQRLARDAGAEVVVTDRWFDNGVPFNQRLGMNQGLSHLHHKDWIGFIDADIVIPISIKDELVNARRDCLHWMKRQVVASRKIYERVLAGEEIQCIGEKQLPACGYCQIFHASDNLYQPLPEGCPTAGRGDLIFRNRWPRSKWICLTGTCLHLGDSRVNWQGRKAPKW
jgi:glycosyltransferase involved in cell wall biosynthesis